MVSAIIVAAGKGTRMGPDIDKLFLEIAGEPLITHTWRRFDSLPDFSEIILVVRDGMQPAFEEIALRAGFKKPYRLVKGGAERQDSVWNGLQALHPDTQIVAIQDGARPCTSPQQIRATLVAAAEGGAAVAAQRVIDTIKESSDGSTVDRTLNRSLLWAVQTPQTFQVSVILKALAAVRDSGKMVTDDTAACELIGQPVRLVAGSSPNPKVTLPADIPYIEMLIKNQV